MCCFACELLCDAARLVFACVMFTCLCVPCSALKKCLLFVRYCVMLYGLLLFVCFVVFVCFYMFVCFVCDVLCDAV